MNFWEQNKLFVICIGAVFLVYVYLWPDLFGYWLTPWRGAVVARPDAQTYEAAQREIRKYQERYQKYYHPKGEAVPAGDAIRKVMEGNELLLDNFQTMHHWMSFVRPYPFRIPADRQEKNERQNYVSLAYTFARDGELICDEYGQVRQPHRGIVFATSTRNIALGDSYFGMRDMELPDAIADPDLAILQVALIHEIGQLAIQCGVDKIAAIAPRDPYTWQAKGKDVAKAYPLDATIHCDLPTLMKFLHALDGAHGVVAEVIEPDAVTAAVEPEAAAPLPAAARPEGQPEELLLPEPEPVGPSQKVVIQLFGNPTIFPPDPDRPGLQERFTLFRPGEEGTRDLQFVANAVVIRDLGDGRVEAEVQPNSTLRFAEDGSRTREKVRPEDFAATRFLLIRSLKVDGDEGKLTLDDAGYPKEVTPRHLVVDLSVAALKFLEIEMPKIKRTRVRIKRKPIHRGW
jgi:hypothetical protein